MHTSSDFPLRPLTIGEIFDRAVTIYIQNFVPFTLIVLTMLAPLGAIQVFILPSASQSIAQIAQQASNPKSAPPPVPFSNGQLFALFGILLVVVLLAPFVNNAVALGVARIYRGSAPSYGAQFAAAFRRWLPLLGTALLNVLILSSLYSATVFVVIILITIGVLLISSALPIAVALFILAGIALLAVLPIFLMLLIVYAFSMYATTIENVDPGKAIASGFSRVFGRSEIKKSVLMALAYMGIQLGVTMISATIAVLLTFTLKMDALQVAVSTIINAMLVAFLAILLAVYYYDVRTRKEGLDLENDLDRLVAAT